MATLGFEKLHVYRLSESLSDRIWDLVAEWRPFARDTVGKHVVRAADSVGANIAEGSGRGSFKDNRRFVKVARASLYEAHHFLRRAFRRKLLTAEQTKELKKLLDKLRPRLNAYLRSIGPAAPTKDKGPRTKDK